MINVTIKDNKELQKWQLRAEWEDKFNYWDIAYSHGLEDIINAKEKDRHNIFEGIKQNVALLKLAKYWSEQLGYRISVEDAIKIEQDMQRQ